MLGSQKKVKCFKFAAKNLYNMSESFTHQSVIVATFPTPKCDAD